MLPEEANEFDLFKKFFRVELMLLIVHETNGYARKQSAKNWAALMRVYRDTFTVVTPEKTLPAASQAMAKFSTSDDLGCRAVTQVQIELPRPLGSNARARGPIGDQSGP